MDTQGLLLLLAQILGSGAFAALSVSLLRDKVLPKLPRAVYPLLAYTLALGADHLVTMTTGISDPVRAGFSMAAAHLLREWVTTLKDHGLNG